MKIDELRSNFFLILKETEEIIVRISEIENLRLFPIKLSIVGTALVVASVRDALYFRKVHHH